MSNENTSSVPHKTATCSATWDLIEQLVQLESSKNRLHLEYMDKAMPADVYLRFQNLRDERIPALRSQLRVGLAAARDQPPVHFAYAYADQLMLRCLVPVEPAPQAEMQAEPVIYVSRGQLETHTDPDSDGGRYLPARRTPLGLLNYPLYTAPQAQPADALYADQPEPADLWYLQDTRGYVGNDVLWWAKDGNGYTTDISKAHAYTRYEAFQQAAMRGTDRAWPKAYIDGKTRPAVDMQYIDHQAALAAAQEGGKA
ncbi:hypothetical protein [Comamonas sp.]|uniref:hypothetical protein n=1 Tax=Comamonas sp. TaxID=34028 RepID=UPI0028B13A63|nr:hypothetical protein [Comamonas sp.]